MAGDFECRKEAVDVDWVRRRSVGIYFIYDGKLFLLAVTSEERLLSTCRLSDERKAIIWSQL